MKHIVILSAFLTPFRSGAEAMPEEITTDLQPDFRFTIVTCRFNKSLPKNDALPNGTAVIRIGFGRSFDKWLFPFIAPLYVWRMRPDLLHANLESFAGIALLLCKIVCPFVPTVQTFQNTYTNYKGFFETKWLLWPMKHFASRVTVLSTSLQERAEKFGYKKAVVIPNGVRLQTIPVVSKIPNSILYVGRLEDIKGVDILLQAFAKLPKEAHLRIVGDGSKREFLESLVHELCIQDRVTFVGNVPYSQVLQEFAHADIFCGLSRSEAFGNVFIEAQAAGCAVVATNIEGITDIITHEENGLLVPVENVEAAASALLDVYMNTEKRTKLQIAGKKNATQFDWSAIAATYKSIYQSLLS